jgi:MFS family permease
LVTGDRGAMLPSSDHARQTFVAHQSVDGACGDPVSLPAQMRGHLAPAIQALRTIGGGAQRIGEIGIGDNSVRRWGGFPVPIRAWGNLKALGKQDPADRLDPITVRTHLFDELENQRRRRSSSPTKKIEAALRISFASLKSRTSRSNSLNRIILGAAEGPAGPLANSMAHSWFPPERRGLPSALIGSGAPLAKIFLAPILTLLILGLGWRYAFLALAALGLVWTVGWVIKGRTGPYATSSGGSVPDKQSTHAGGPVTARETFRWAVCNRTFAGLLLATFPMHGLTTVVISWMPAYLESGLGFSPMQAGFLYGLPSVAALALMLGAGDGTDRLLRRGISPRVARGLVPTLALCLGGALVALLPVAAAEHRWAALVLLMAGYGIGTLGIPVSYAAIGTLAEPSQRSSVLSLFIAMQTFSGVIAPWLTGVLIDAGNTQVDGYNTAFVVIGSTIVVAAAVGALLVDPTRDDVVARLRRRAGAS